MLRTWHFLHFHTCDMLRKSWVGLGGWGGDDDVSITSTHVKLVEAARTIVPTTLKKGKHECEWSFFFRWFLLPNVKSQKLSSATSFGGFFYTSVKNQNRKIRGNYQWFWYDPCCPTCKLPGVTNNAGTTTTDLCRKNAFNSPKDSSAGAGAAARGALGTEASLAGQNKGTRRTCRSLARFER